MKPLKTLKFIAQSTALIALTAFASDTLAEQPKFGRIVSFGASLSDTGNAFIFLSKPENSGCGVSLNVPPYDSLDIFKTPDGTYAKGGHHFTNGATWLEGLARYLALSGNVRPAFQNTGIKASNYAVGGARAIADYPCRLNLPAQLNAFFTTFR